MSDTTIATAADYADAMITARHARNWLFWILLLVLLVQLSIFFVARYSPELLSKPIDGTSADISSVADAVESAVAEATSAIAATTQEAADAPAGTTAARTPLIKANHTVLADALQYVTNGSVLVGIVALAILAIVLLLIVQIMLIGRLIGVSHLTSAFIWAIVLGVLLFPWQAYLNFPGLGDTSFRLPGVLYTWSELAADAQFNLEPMQAALKWARFVGFPVLAVLILITVQVKSRRGLKLALGETEPVLIETGAERQ